MTAKPHIPIEERLAVYLRYSGAKGKLRELICDACGEINNLRAAVRHLTAALPDGRPRRITPIRHPDVKPYDNE